MSRVLPKPHEAKQLCRLRGLRVRRARERCTQALAEVDKAVRALHERQRQIAGSRHDIEALEHTVAHRLGPSAPRWVGVVSAQRERLADRLERDEYALITDEHDLEEAQERLQEVRAELTRALAQEEAVRGLACQTHQAYVANIERRVDLELEDQACAAPRGNLRMAA